MVLRITLLIIGFCFFFHHGSSYHVKKGKKHSKEYIIDGTDRSIDAAAHHVQLIKHVPNTKGELEPQYFCGGSLITYEIVLTAAHCLTEVKNVEVYAGSAKLYEYIEKRSLAIILVHPYVSPNDKIELKKDKDIAMIKVDKPFSSSKITPIPLTMAPPKDFEDVTINGFGYYENYYRDFSPNLRQLTGTLVNCSHPEFYTRTEICMQTPVGKGACFGDSGGGLVNSKPELIGVLARVYAPCSSYKMDWYTSVYDNLNFIIAGLQRLSPDDELANNIVKQMNNVFTKKIAYVPIEPQ